MNVETQNVHYTKDDKPLDPRQDSALVDGYPYIREDA